MSFAYVEWGSGRRPVAYRPLTDRLFGTFEAASIKWEILIAVLRCLSDCVFAYYARSSVRSCRRRWNREKTAGDSTHNNAMRLCIYVLPVPPARAPCARRVAGGLSTRRAINLITGDTFWEPVISRKPVNRLTGYRFTSLIYTHNLQHAASIKTNVPSADVYSALFTQRNFVAEFLQVKCNFTRKMAVLCFWAPLGLRSNVQYSSQGSLENYLLVLIELFSLCITAQSIRANYRVKISVFAPIGSVWP